jgi:peptidoglycan/LPS O-acetylase OafA/YrhL
MFLSRFRRITRDGRWIPEIDGLRFIAIASVFLFHLRGELGAGTGRTIPIEARYAWLQRLLENGYRGVGIFFVISGMILAMPYARHYLLGAKPVSLRKYYLRRVTRLEPPYFASILLVVLMLAVYQRSFTPGFFAHVAANLAYLHTLVFGQMSTVNSVTWSLEVEIQFYILAPLIMRVFLIRPTVLRRGLMLVAIFAIGIAQMPFEHSLRFIMSILYYVQYFLAGLLVADIFVLDLEQIRPSRLWDAAGLGALGLTFRMLSGDPQRILMPVLVGIVCIAALRSLYLRRFFASPWIAITGGMCYSIYLLHVVVGAAVFKLTRHAILPHADFLVNYLIQIALLGPLVLAVSTLFFLLIERPCMDPAWPQKLWARFRGTPDSPAAEAKAAGYAE